MATCDYLVFDFGAGSGRALLAQFNGRRAAFREVHRFENHPVMIAGTLCWDVLRLQSELAAGLQKAARRSRRIVSLGIDAWGVDGGFIDRNGKLIANPVNYRDKLRNAMARRVAAVIPNRELFRLTGLFPYSISTLCLFHALKKSGAPEMKCGRKFLMLPDLFNYLLTGKACAEYTEATTSGMLNQTTGRWEERIFRKFSLPREIMPEIVRPGTSLGKISGAVSSELNVPALPVVAVAGHDSASAVAGVPAAGANKWAFISMGTWFLFGVEREKPLINDAVFANGFWNAGGAENNSFLAGSYTGLFIIQQCFNFWRKNLRNGISWERILAECARAVPFQSVIDVDDKRFAAFQPDMPAVIAGYCRERGRKVPKTVGEIARCCYESLVLKTRKIFHAFEEMTGEKFDVVHLVGGGVRNTLLCRWIADALRVKVLAGPAEATVAGNFLVQLKAFGKIKSIAEGRSIIADSIAVREYFPGNSWEWDDASK